MTHENMIKSLHLLFFLFIQSYAQGPDERSLMFNACFGPGKHFSTIADEEGAFSDNFGFYVWYRDTVDGVNDTIALSYNYLNLSADINASWHLSEVLSFGINYQYGNISQSIDSEKWERSASLVDLHRFSVMMTFWPMFRRKLSFSGAALAGPGIGNLHRFAVIEENYTQKEATSDFLTDANAEVRCIAFTAGARLNAHLFISDAFYFLFSGSYDFAAITLKDDPLQGYPVKHRSHELSIRFGIGFVTNAQ